MAKISNANIDAVQFAEQTVTPATPASGKWRLYFKSDGMYAVDDTGTTIGPFGAGGSSGDLNPDTPPTSPGTLDDEFSTGTAINTSTRWTLWSAVGSGTPDSEVVDSGAYICRGPGSGTFRRAYTQPISGTSWSVRAKFRMMKYVTDGASAYRDAWDGIAQQFGLICGTVSDGKHILGGLQVYGADEFRIRNNYFTNTTAGSAAGYWATPTILNSDGLASFGFYLQMNYSSGGVSTFLSLSGHPYTFLLSSGSVAGAHLSAEADRVGFCFSNDGSTQSTIFVCDWFRRIS